MKNDLSVARYITFFLHILHMQFFLRESFFFLLFTVQKESRY